MKEAKEVEYPLNGSSYQKDEDKFMRLAICNRKVMERNGRPVYHIDMGTKDHACAPNCNHNHDDKK